ATCSATASTRLPDCRRWRVRVRSCAARTCGGTCDRGVSLRSTRSGSVNSRAITGKVWVFSVHDPASSPELGSQPLPVWRAALTRLARLGKVLVAYVVASLITWQLVHALTAQLQLPAWVEPLA